MKSRVPFKSTLVGICLFLAALSVALFGCDKGAADEETEGEGDPGGSAAEPGTYQPEIDSLELPLPKGVDVGSSTKQEVLEDSDKAGLDASVIQRGGAAGDVRIRPGDKPLPAGIYQYNVKFDDEHVATNVVVHGNEDMPARDTCEKIRSYVDERGADTKCIDTSIALVEGENFWKRCVGTTAGRHPVQLLCNWSDDVFRFSATLTD